MDKTDMERLLYKRAYALGAQITQREGALVCQAQDELLQQLITLYNRFFKRENLLFSLSDIRLTQQYYTRQALLFEQELRQRGPCGRSTCLLKINLDSQNKTE